MIKLYQLLRYAYLSLSCLLTATTVCFAATALETPVKVDNRTPASKNAPTAQKQAAEQVETQEKIAQDFDTIRHFYSYDPATDKWSIIEDFETVDILEDITQQREGYYIYHNFWSYDPLQERWYKVAIRDHGYKQQAGAATTKEKETSITKVHEKKDKEKNKGSLWKNLVLSLSAGGGYTFYQNHIDNMQLIHREDAFFLAPTDVHHAYRIQWFEDHFEKNGAFSQNLVGVPYTAGRRDATWKGQGWSLPITLALHYTFFKRLIIGLGGEVLLNHLKTLTHDDEAITTKEFFIPKWFYHSRLLALLGCKFIRKPTYTVLVDLKGCLIAHQQNLLRGDTIKEGMGFNIGLGYEKKLTNYFKGMARLSYDRQFFQDKGLEQTVSVKYIQPAIHLQLGLNFNFAKDTEEK